MSATAAAILDAEHYCVGALLRAETLEEAATLFDSAGDLEPAHFQHRALAEAFAIAGRLIQAGRLPDVVTMKNELMLVGNGHAGAFIARTLDGLPRMKSLAQWAEMIRARAAKADTQADAPGAERVPEDGPAVRIAESLPAFLERVRRLPEPRWLVRDLIPDEGVLVWHGRPRAMKSLTAADVMLSLALGEPCALSNPRFAIDGAVGVLWLCEEDPERLNAFRFGLMLKGRGILPGHEPESFRLVVRPGWDLESPSGQAELVATIKATSAAMTTPLLVIVIDPARASLPSLDGGPKDAAKARAFLLSILRETSVRVILLPHHDAKPRADGKDERSRAERASGGVTFSMGDCMLSFERLNDREAMVVPNAYKVSSDPQPFRVRFESDTPAGQGFRGYLRAVAESAEEDTGTREQVLAFVRDNPWSTTAEVDRGAKVRTGEAARYLAQLEAAGILGRLTGPEAKAHGRSPNAVLWGCR